GSAGMQPERRLEACKRQVGRGTPSPACPCRFKLQSEKSQGVWGTASPSSATLAGSKTEKLQLAHRLGAPLIRHVLATFRAEEIKAPSAAERLGLSRARFYKLYASYLGTCAHHQELLWTPSVSGGDHAAAWPPEVDALLQKRLSSKPPASYSFAASEVLRCCRYKIDRGQVRQWAMENNLAHPKPNHRPTAPVKRWQRSRIGEL